MLHEDAGKKRDSAEEKTLSLRQQLDLIEEQLQHLEQTIETDSELIEEEETKPAKCDPFPPRIPGSNPAQLRRIQ